MVSVDPSDTCNAPLASLPPRLVLFDGICGLCDRTVRMLLDRDTAGRLRFATLQGETARALAQRHPDAFPTGVDSLVYVDATGPQPRFLVRSQATFAIAREVPSLRRWAWLSLLPRWLTDLGYRLLAAVRHRVFGRLDACRIPSVEDRARFLD